MGYKEIRKKNGLPEDVPEGDMIFNGIYYQMKMAEQQSAMMGGGGFGGNSPFGGQFEEQEENPFEQQGKSQNPFENQENNNPFESNNEEEENPFMKALNTFIDQTIHSDV